MGRSTFSSLRDSKPRGFIRELDPFHFRALGEVDHRKSVDPGELNKNAARRTVRVGLESHGPHWLVELYLPYCLLALKINHCGGFAFQRSAGRVLAMRPHVLIMDDPVHRHPDATLK